MPPLAHLTGRNQYAPKRNNPSLADILSGVKRMKVGERGQRDLEMGLVE